MPTLGENCHVILSHPDIDAGEDYGFVCVLDDSIREGGVQMTREVVTSEPGDPNPTSGTSLFCHFDVLMADELRNPDGSQHSASRSADYAKLSQFLGKQSGITLIMPLGAVVNL